MKMRHKSVVTLTFTSLLLTACASKGFVKDQIEASQKLTTAYTDSTVNAAMSKEVAARTAGDEELRNQMTAQQAAIDSLKTQFHAAVAVVGSAIRFAVPVNFAFDDATVRDNDQGMLDRFAAIVTKYYTGSVITVEGFTDPAGSKTYNKGLSQRRAEAVAQYLMTKGMDSTHVRAVGYGKDRLVHPDASHDDPGAEQNRRVAFVVETSPEAASTSAGEVAPQ